METLWIKCKKLSTIVISVYVLLFTLAGNIASASDYQSLTQLFTQWREFEHPPLFNGAPDYRTKTFDSRQQNFQAIRQQLLNIDSKNWPIAQQVDWHILWAELNGYEFNYKVLKPWQRDPAFYKSVWSHRSDVPAHEGPTHHGVTELWSYKFSLAMPPSFGKPVFEIFINKLKP